MTIAGDVEGQLERWRAWCDADLWGESLLGNFGEQQGLEGNLLVALVWRGELWFDRVTVSSGARW